MAAGTPTRPFRIAVLPGDGIGKEVMPEGLRALDAAAQRFGIAIEYSHFEWASCDYYAAHGKMMPDDWKAQLQGMDALFFGAVGWPATVPDHVSLWGSLLKFRREFDQYVNLRPVRLFEGVPCPLAGRKPGDIDYFVVRENTEGEYTSLGGVMYEGTEREMVIQESVYSRVGAQRLLKFAFELAQSRPRKHVTLATKSNGIAISMPWWDKQADEVKKAYPEVALDKQHIDILSARFVLQPGRFDVVAATNLFGDILSDLVAGLVGGLGMAPGANIGADAAIFEAVHGSAPDIAGKGIANPIALMLAAAQMLDHVKRVDLADRLRTAIDQTLNVDNVRTGDLGGGANTIAFTKALVARIKGGA